MAGPTKDPTCEAACKAKAVPVHTQQHANTARTALKDTLRLAMLTASRDASSGNARLKAAAGLGFPMMDLAAEISAAVCKCLSISGFVSASLSANQQFCLAMGSKQLTKQS